MANVEVFDPSDIKGTDGQRIVVIGSGPVGMRFVQELFKRRPDARVMLFGNEPYQPYNRIKLTSFLAGEVEREDIDIPLPEDGLHPNFSYHIASIKSIDRTEKLIIDQDGQVYEYDILVLATGARAHIPHVDGIDKKGVYTFRSLKDTEFLYARKTSARHIVVVGGGLLGIEAAKAMQRLNTKVTLIHQGEHLMNRQLDATAAGHLQGKLEADGIYVITNSGVRQVHGNGGVTGVKTRDGAEIICDTVLLCTGIQPNSEMARHAGLRVSTGIAVDDQLLTSDKSIYAIGECCEHRGQTYGLVAPGYEQAAVAAQSVYDRIYGTSVGDASLREPRAHYVGSLSVSRLKVIGEPVCSMGEVVNLADRPFQTELNFSRKSQGVFRKVVVHKGKIIGAAGTGDWPEVARIQEAFQNERRLWPWQNLWFRISGNFWIGDGQSDVRSWPNDVVICQCNSLTKGALTEVINQGCTDVQTLQARTRAGTVCGTCKPLLSELVGSGEPLPKEVDWKPAIIGSLLAFIVAMVIAFIPESQVSDSVQTTGWFEKIWNDKFWKQVTGFTLLGLTAVGLLMSLRKRLGFEKMGSFGFWRGAHMLLGVCCASILIFHTGFHLGSNLNQLLMFNFLAVVVMGAVAGTLVGMSHQLSPSRARKLRKATSFVHILVTWPLPILLGVHILTVYYF